MAFFRSMISVLALAACASAAEHARAPVAPPATEAVRAAVSLDFLEGDWFIHDQTGAQIGRATIELPVPGAMVFEQRTIGQGQPQPLWFEYAERTGGWLQLFLNPSGHVREFTTESAAGEWPLVMGAQTRLRDGAMARFRLTMTRASDDESRRLLEMSRDDGASWIVVFDYTYRRAGAH